MGLIDKYHVDSKYIIFEITENTYIHNVEAVNRMIQTFHQRDVYKRQTNDDIAGFCGISTRNSVNRILRGLRENGIIFIADQKILIKDKEYLEQYVKG